MKLVHAMMEQAIEFEENKINLLVIENAANFSKVIQELVRQVEGEKGEFVLSENGKEVELKKYSEIVINPFEIAFNQKKIQTALYKEIEKAALGETLFPKTKEVQGIVTQYLHMLSDEFIYPISFDEEITIPALLKCGNLCIDTGLQSMLERVVEYIKIAMNLLNTKLFLFVNLKTYLEDDELEAFYQMIKNEKANVLLLERNIVKRRQDEVVRIIDKDLCEL